jgi:hypothetical protein
MKVLCAWCDTVKYDDGHDDGQESHGLCEACYKKQQAAAKRIRDARREEAYKQAADYTGINHGG